MIKKPSKTAFFLSIAALIVFVMLTSAVVIFRRDAVGQQSKATTSSPIRSIGLESAPITIEVFSDFGCITCRVWHQTGIAAKIVSVYGDKIQFIWHDFPVITSNSPKAAEAGFCANDQGKFWEYHNIIFENYPRLSPDDLKSYAMQVEMDVHSFNACLDSSKHHQAVEAEMEQGYAYGFRATPSFLVNGKALISPPSYEQLSTLIDELLSTNENNQ